MMLLLAEGMTRNIAVAAIDEPTFVGKSRILRTIIEQRLPSVRPSFHLYFLLGWDTLIRLFDPRFYHDDSVEMNRVLRRFFADEEENGDASRITCARRPSSSSDVEAESRFMQSDAVKEYVASGEILMIDLPTEVRDISSTKVRNMMKNLGKCTPRDQDGLLGDLVSTEVAKYISEKGLYSVNE